MQEWSKDERDAAWGKVRIAQIRAKSKGLIGQDVSIDLQCEVTALREAAKLLVDSMETCHICQGLLVLQEAPAHCEDCSYDCEGHEEPECTPIYELHRKLKETLARIPQ